MFARLWYVGLALTPVLIIACFYLRSRTAATRRHAVGVAVLLALLMSTCLPIVREPGALLQNAREDFKAIGLAVQLANCRRRRGRSNRPYRTSRSSNNL